ncbi:hypothetical protein EDB84DRAFT_1434998 [Lactarius hengduanensis]|nr:hypothetical protein EDB84DRAFT_1434998 [Lactarius hengduanensis]
MPTLIFTSETKLTAGNDRENQPGPSGVCPEGDARGTHEQLEACEYQVALAPVGLMSRELISNSKLEATSSRPQIELIAKHLREGSNELHILEYLRTIRCTLSGNDIFRLQTIDIGVAIEVQDENTEVDEYRDTKGWAALEMGEEDGPTPIPIKVDRWSDGRVGDNRLSEFAEQLMANDPQQRPLLKCYLNGTSGPLYRSVVANALVDCGKDPQPRQDMVEESMKLPDAKKPRLADDWASSSARHCDTQMST